MLEYKNGQFAINPKFTKLITSLRTAVDLSISTAIKRSSHSISF
jgi:hypothetical protein